MIKERVNKIFEKQSYDLYPDIPNNMLIELSNHCNSNCVFCANNKMTRKRGSIDYEFLCNLLLQAYKLGVREVGFYTTGEPLIYKKLPDAIKYAKDLGYAYTYITTNGILADIERLKKLIDNGLDSIKFSINAINREDYIFIHGTDKFDIVLNNLKNIYDFRKDENLKFKIFVSYIATKYTEYETKQIKDFFKNYCDEVLIVNIRNQSGMMPVESEKLCCQNENDKIQANRIIPCHYLFNVINVSYEGYLTGCCTDFQNYLAYADLNKTSLLDGWTNSVITNLRKQHLDNNINNNLCYNCITNSLKIPQPLDNELATIFNKNCFYPIDSFCDRIKRKEDENGIS